LAITIESLKVVSYLKTEHLGDGRTVKLMPLWDGTNWRMWVDTPVGLIEGKMMDTIEGDYVGVGAAKESDLFIPFVHLMWQRASWPEVCPLISAISDDFHNMGTSLAKLKHFFHSQRTLPPRSASRFAYTELEYLVMLTRAVFDLLQEMIRYCGPTTSNFLTNKRRVVADQESCPQPFLGWCFGTNRILGMRLKSKRSLDSQNRLLKNTQELPRSSLNCVIFETQWSMAALGLERYTLQSKDSASIPSTGHSRPLMAGDPNTTTTRTSRPSCHGLQT